MNNKRSVGAQITVLIYFQKDIRLYIYVSDTRDIRTDIITSFLSFRIRGHNYLGTEYTLMNRRHMGGHDYIIPKQHIDFTSNPNLIHLFSRKFPLFWASIVHRVPQKYCYTHLIYIHICVLKQEDFLIFL